MVRQCPSPAYAFDVSSFRLAGCSQDSRLVFFDEVGAGVGSSLVAKEASDDAQELEGAVGLRDVAVATRRTSLLLIPLHRE
jgi:hypothetical protein